MAPHGQHSPAQHQQWEQGRNEHSEGRDGAKDNSWFGRLSRGASMLLTGAFYAYVISSLPNLVYSTTDQDGPARVTQVDGRAMAAKEHLANIAKSLPGGKEPRLDDNGLPVGLSGPAILAGDKAFGSHEGASPFTVRLESGAHVSGVAIGKPRPGVPVVLIMCTTPSMLHSMRSALASMGTAVIAYSHAGAPSTWPLGGLQASNVTQAVKGGVGAGTLQQLYAASSRPGGSSKRVPQSADAVGSLLSRAGSRVDRLGGPLDSAVAAAVRGDIHLARADESAGRVGTPLAMLRLAGRDPNAVSARAVHGRPLATPDALAAEAAGVLQALGVTSDVVVVATHYDWLAALRFAEKNAAGVSGLLLLDPLLPWPTGPLPEEYPRLDGAHRGLVPSLGSSGRHGVSPSGLAYLPARTVAMLDTTRGINASGGSAFDVDGSALPGMDLLRLAQLEGSRHAAMATARGGRGSFVTGPNAPYCADPLAAGAAAAKGRKQPPARAEPARAGLPEEWSEWPRSLVSSAAAARIVERCAILTPRGGPGDVVERPALRRLVAAHGLAALDPFAGGAPVSHGDVIAARPVVFGDRRSCGLHLPLLEMAAQHA